MGDIVILPSVPTKESQNMRKSVARLVSRISVAGGTRVW